ncbi:HK97 gp10 family phage protein [Xenorhabdus bovienii]|uniref:HK97-gp10 family putative phage morphogenesis protein n=1 Tax=Xenorhabdus bovienii TaxID=40576 RepID=UPI0023B29914|nr:HK97-gp10 family putative phage morphogenesis protein [Xenorhabdus bovienii]MDE9492688.1 HK97 gp10 family phage protein [Xenorhabdus bovienii]MDE9501215.1 HK97 gp10 family phage protein [Xenorhabdus bovienii]MDE9526394.1 HK97 gp10 family phage protein [Xenorhabdus bovienii]MDE9569822.1 HK97 gp10 family phage protein [Xenorhabdus bovienii]
MITAQTTGWAELGRKLQALDSDLQTQILRKAGKAAMEIVKKDMEIHAGYDKKSEGSHMRDNINIRSTKAKKYKGGMMITVGPTKPHRMKALAQEMGTIKQVPNPFIRPALDYNKTAVVKVLAQEIRDALSGYSQ